MAIPAMRIPLGLNMTEFQKNIETAKGSTSIATKFITNQFLEMNIALLQSASTARTVAVGLRAVVGVLAPLGIAVAGIVGVFKLMGYATELAKEKIEEFNAIAEKAAKSNVSTDFFQRFTKSGEALKLTVDEVNEALERFNRTSADALGGSTLAQRVAELQKAGNFAGNNGVAALAGSTDTEAKLRATVKLINEALESGQRLAALDIAEKAFGPKITESLRQSAGFLDQMLATSAKISADKIISDEQVGQAIELKRRLEDAQKVLAEKFKPVQDDLAKLGVNYHDNWVSIVEVMSSAVSKANQLYDGLKGIPGVLNDLGNAPFWKKLLDASERMGLNSRPEGLIVKGEQGFSDPAGFAALRAGLANPAARRQQAQQATDIQSSVRGDTSKAPAKAVADVNDQYDRAIESLQKHTARLQADTAAVGLGTGALEEYRARNTLLTAAQQAGIPVAGETAKKIEEIAKAAGAAGDALAKARVQNDIKRGSASAFLTPEDVAIAQQLERIYGADIPAALASSEAAALRLNNVTRDIASTISGNLAGSISDVMDGTKSAGEAFEDFSRIAVRAINEAIVKLLIVGPLMRSLQGAFGGGGGGFDISSIFSGIGNNATGTDNWRGGPTWVGERGPEIVNLPKGSQVIPNDVATRGGSGSVTVNLVEDASRAGQTEKKDNNSGGFDLTVFVDAITAKNAANPGSATSSALRNRGRLAGR